MREEEHRERTETSLTLKVKFKKKRKKYCKTESQITKDMIEGSARRGTRTEVRNFLSKQFGTQFKF